MTTIRLKSYATTPTHGWVRCTTDFDRRESLRQHGSGKWTVPSLWGVR